MLYNHNGEFVNSVKLEVDNRSFLYGDGLFESLRLFNGKVFNRENHLRRLEYSLKELHLKLAVSTADLLNTVELLARENQWTNCAARISIYRNSGGLYTPTTFSASYIIECKEETEDSFQLGFADRIGVYKQHLKSKELLSTIKSSSANLYVLASIEKKNSSMDELLLLNSDSRPIEGTNSNLFIVKKGQIFTPSLSEGPLLGCMRALVISCFEVKEKKLDVSDVQNADEVFFTNCYGVRSVRRFGKCNDYQHIVSKRLVEHLNTLI